MPQVKFNSKEFYLSLCYHIKKRCGRFYLPDAVQIHFGVSEFKPLTVGSSERGFRGFNP